MLDMKKLLFVCTENKMRSPTAEAVLKGMNGYEVKSAGTSKQARVSIDRGLLEWADRIYVFEKKHVDAIRYRWPDQLRKVINLHIPDEYDYMQSELVDLILSKVMGL